MRKKAREAAEKAKLAAPQNQAPCCTCVCHTPDSACENNQQRSAEPAIIQPETASPPLTASMLDSGLLIDFESLYPQIIPSAPALAVSEPTKERLVLQRLINRVNALEGACVVLAAGVIWLGSVVITDHIKRK